MVGGITTHWKQTVAYYSTGNLTDGRVFSSIVLHVMKCCHDIGIKVAAVTSDIGSSDHSGPVSPVRSCIFMQFLCLVSSCIVDKIGFLHAHLTETADVVSIH